MFWFLESMLSAHANSTATAAIVIRETGRVNQPMLGRDMMNSDLGGQWEAAGLLVASLLKCSAAWEPRWGGGGPRESSRLKTLLRGRQRILETWTCSSSWLWGSRRVAAFDLSSGRRRLLLLFLLPSSSFPLTRLVTMLRSTTARKTTSQPGDCPQSLTGSGRRNLSQVRWHHFLSWVRAPPSAETNRVRVPPAGDLLLVFRTENYVLPLLK